MHPQTQVCSAVNRVRAPTDQHEPVLVEPLNELLDEVPEDPVDVPPDEALLD